MIFKKRSIFIYFTLLEAISIKTADNKNSLH
jgi:hypothetical protein